MNAELLAVIAELRTDERRVLLVLTRWLVSEAAGTSTSRRSAGNERSKSAGQS
jgi:hypothetical protein